MPDLHAVHGAAARPGTDDEGLVLYKVGGAQAHDTEVKLEVGNGHEVLPEAKGPHPAGVKAPRLPRRTRPGEELLPLLKAGWEGVSKEAGVLIWYSQGVWLAARLGDAHRLGQAQHEARDSGPGLLGACQGVAGADLPGHKEEEAHQPAVWRVREGAGELLAGNEVSIAYLCCEGALHYHLQLPLAPAKLPLLRSGQALRTDHDAPREDRRLEPVKPAGSNHLRPLLRQLHPCCRLWPHQHWAVRPAFRVINAINLSPAGPLLSFLPFPLPFLLLKSLLQLALLLSLLLLLRTWRPRKCRGGAYFRLLIQAAAAVLRPPGEGEPPQGGDNSLQRLHHYHVRRLSGTGKLHLVSLKGQQRKLENCPCAAG
mmetsp:Transcript_14681/g.41299  ORF Transcript_14681/g.41299 Transcript_14681/m.41299 type:complete len:369 (+) Transcript_14681:228-1334(+)